MFDLLYLIASIGFIVWVTRNIIFWTGVIEKNDYSLLRTKQFLTRSPYGRRILVSPVNLLKWAVIIFYPIIIFYETYTESYHILIAAIYCFEILIVTKEIFQHRSFLRRKVSPKSFSIIILAIFFAIVTYSFPPLDRYLWLVLIDRFLVLFLAMCILGVALPEELLWDYIAVRASKKIQSYKNLKTILLIGGEETTVLKRLLFHALSTSYSVLQTPRNPHKNAIMQTILIQLSNTHDFFITDIAEASDSTVETIHDLIRPRITLISRMTNILFHKQTAQENLTSFRKRITKGGLVFVNKNDTLLAKMFPLKKKNIRFYASQPINNASRIEGFVIEKDKSTMTITVQDSHVTLSSRLISEVSINYLLPVVEILSEIGIPAETISVNLSSAKIFGGFLEHIERHGVTYINNTSDTSSKNLLLFPSYLSLFSGKKILIFDPEVINRFGDRVYMLTKAKQLAKEYDYIFLVGSSNNKALKKGLARKKNYVTDITAEKGAKYVHDLVREGDIVICHGPEAAYCYELIIKRLRKENANGL